jgi:hypothetical protein
MGPAERKLMTYALTGFPPWPGCVLAGEVKVAEYVTGCGERLRRL